MMPKGELLWSGCCEFPAATGADGAMKFMDVPRLAIVSEETFLLSVRNGSEDEIIAVNVGQMLAARPYSREGLATRATVLLGTFANADYITTLKPHRLKVGDRIIFLSTAGGVTHSVYYYVIPSFLMTDFVFQISATPGGAAVDLAATSNNFYYVPSPLDAVPEAIGAFATNIFTTTVAHGLTKGDAVWVKESVDLLVAGTIYYVVTTPTAFTFTLSATRGGATFDPCAGGANVTAAFFLADEFYSHTSFSVGIFAAGTYQVPVAGMISKLIQGWPYGANGGRILVSPGDQDYDAFCVTAEIRRA